MTETNVNGTAVPPPTMDEIPEDQRVLSQQELVAWWHDSDAPQAIKDAVSVLLRNHVPGAQAVELLYRQHTTAPPPPIEAETPKTTLYIRCRPRKGTRAESAGEIMRAVLSGETPEIPTSVFVDDTNVADVLVSLFDVIVEGKR